MNKFKILFAFSLILSSVNVLAQNVDDSLKRVLATTKDPKQKIKILTTLSDDYSESNADTSLYYANALHDLAVKIKDRSAEGYALGNIAFYYMHVGNLVKSLQLTFASLQIFESIKDSVNIANAYNGMGHIYRHEKDWKNAYKYYRMERTLGLKIKDYRDDAFGSLNLALLFTKDNRLDSAMYYAKRAVALQDKYHVNYSKAYSLGIVADVYYAQGNHATALTLYRQAIDTAAKVHDPNIDAVQLKYASQLYKSHLVDSALSNAKRILPNQKKILLLDRADLYSLLASIYKDKGVYKAAYEYQQKAQTLRDSLINTEQTQQTANLLFNEQQHQLDLKKAAIAYQEKLNNRLKLYAVIGIAVVFLIIGIILWRSNRRQKQTNVLLSEQKEEIETQRDHLGQALEELKNTQAQLVQREKMASLGELTAGIAHEIQNPLNFVNNFSDVNREMLEDLKAESEKPKAERDEQLETELINDLIENEQKINHHGKRADAIVKGMLQHSKAGSGTKEPTDINALADEYLRLAYHGLRSKDKSFNAELVTYFDKGLPQINAIPQDIGRVMLNLFNNAFYAVNQKQKTAGPDYKPTVEVSTELYPFSGGGGLIIKVKDNGIGIPDAVKDKIMQPFFTTKPTGEGTGLGLSLTYDMVVKGHSGRIDVDTKEGGFTEFIVTLPLS